MTNSPEAPLTTLTVGMAYSAVVTGVAENGDRIYRPINFIAGRELIEEGFAGGAGTPGPSQDRVMKKVWSKPLSQFENHPLLVLSGSIVAF